MVARSFLYVPADAGDKLAKALYRGADAVTVDLEDAIAPSRKDDARGALVEWLNSLSARESTGSQIWVRVNPGCLRDLDIRAAVHPRVSGILLAKTETPNELTVVDKLVTELENERGIPVGSVPVVPLLESASALFEALAIARSPRVCRLQLGEADLKADLGVRPGRDEPELLWARSHIVAACAAATIDPPVAPVSVGFRDLDDLRESTLRLKALGFFGRSCIHPAQIDTVNEVFTPTEDEVSKANAIIAGFEQSIGAGSGVFATESGRMIDEAVVKQARRTVLMARAAGSAPYESRAPWPEFPCAAREST